MEFIFSMLTPLPPAQWKRPQAAHLLNRAGFGGSPAAVDALAAGGLAKAVEQLLNAPDDAAQFPKPTWAEPLSYQMMILQNGGEGMDQEARKSMIRERQRDARQEMMELVSWWLQRMATTPNPLREKLTLFWHGHFATGVTKVRDSYKMWRQNETLRTNAFGDFGTLVKLMARDPAMLVYLDGADSLRSKPNENWGRELLELFTLGIGNYSEDDIKNAARAFTGYKINPADLTFYYSKLQHDDGEKTFLGQKGKFGGDEIVDLVLAQPACAEFIGRKVWRFFVDDNPTPATVQVVAARLRANRYAMKPFLREVFTSAEFYAPGVIRAQVKSPVQWMVASARELETKLPGPVPLANALRQLGQVPFDPPNVKGWDGGKAWITTSTLLARYNLSNFLIGNGSMMTTPPAKKVKARSYEIPSRATVDFAAIAPAELRKSPPALVATLTQRLFQGPLPARETEKFVQFLTPQQANITDQTIRDLLHLMMSTPEYQLT